MTKSMKRIHKVTVKRMVDESPDTSWLGEYANSPDSAYSIDRAHSRDCHSLEANHRNVVETLEHAITYLNTQIPDDTLCTCDNRSWYGEEHDTACELEGFRDANDSIEDAQNILIAAQDDVAECDCGFSGQWNNREYRYFNPNWQNYKGEPDADIRRYCEQDYMRMERLNAGDWCFIGIRAEAEYSVGTSRGGYLAQELTSGGLWGIESYSEEFYLAFVESEELADLRTQLTGIGFSKRAIAAAFKNIERETN